MEVLRVVLIMLNRGYKGSVNEMVAREEVLGLQKIVGKCSCWLVYVRFICFIKKGNSSNPDMMMEMLRVVLIMLNRGYKGLVNEMVAKEEVLGLQKIVSKYIFG